MTICKILEGILPKESVRGAPPPDKKLLEYHFVFACVWAFGGCMLVDKVITQQHIICYLQSQSYYFHVFALLLACTCAADCSGSPDGRTVLWWLTGCKAAT